MAQALLHGAQQWDKKQQAKTDAQQVLPDYDLDNILQYSMILY